MVSRGFVGDFMKQIKLKYSKTVGYMMKQNGLLQITSIIIEHMPARHKYIEANIL